MRHQVSWFVWGYVYTSNTKFCRTFNMPPKSSFALWNLLTSSSYRVTVGGSGTVLDCADRKWTMTDLLNQEERSSCCRWTVSSCHRQLVFLPITPPYTPFPWDRHILMDESSPSFLCDGSLVAAELICSTLAIFETGSGFESKVLNPAVFGNTNSIFLPVHLFLSSCIQCSVAVDTQEARSSACTWSLLDFPGV